MLREKFSAAAGKAWDLCVHTRIEMVVGAVLLTAPAALMSYQHEGTKLGQIPLAFSEIDRTVSYIENDSDEKVPPLTMFYSTVNDTVMQVFEANNAAYADGEGSDAAFARALEERFIPRSTADYMIATYAARIPEYARAARAVLDPLASANDDLRAVEDSLDDAWSASHIDHYKSVSRTRRVCTSNSEGKQSCRTEHYTERVYDYTDHYFRYNAAAGNEAARLLNRFAAAHPDVRIPEELLKATAVSEENRAAIRDSRVNVNDGREPTDDEYLALTNTWATGSNYERLTPEIYGAHAGILSAAPAWDDARETARTRHYRTSFRSQGGPEQYRVAERALDHVESFRRHAAPLLGGIDHAAAAIPALERRIGDFVNVALHGTNGDSGDLRAEIMDDARAVYRNNYVAGFDVNPAKWYMVAVWAIIGALGGTAFGFGADMLVARRASQLRDRQQQPPRFGRDP